MMFLFVYGTLKNGCSNNGIMLSLDGKFVSPARTAEPIYDLLDIGPFPGLVEGQFIVAGELWDIPPSSLPFFDRFEGVPSLYRRVKLPIFALRNSPEQNITALAYMYNKDNLNRTDHGNVKTIGNMKFWRKDNA